MVAMIKKFITNSFFLSFYTFFAAVLAYFFRLYLAKNLSLASYGLFYIILDFFAFISAFNDLGFSETQAFFIPKYVVKKRLDKIKAVVKVQLFNQFCSTFLISIIVFFAADFLAINIFHEPAAALPLKIALIFFMANDFLMNTKILFYAFQEAKFYGSTDLLKFVFSLPLIMILFTFLGKDLNILLYLWGGITLVIALFFFFLFLIKHKEVVKAPYYSMVNIYKEFFPYLLPTVLSNNFNIFLTASTNILLVFFQGLEVVALYNIAQPIANILLIFLRPIANLLMPIISQADETGQEKQLKSIMGLILNTGVFILLPIPLLLTFYAKESIIFLFGSQFIGATWSLRILSFYLFFNILQDFLVKVLIGLGLQKKRLKLLTLASILNFGFSLLLIPIFGATGAILANSLSVMIFILGSLNLIKEKIKFHLPIKNYIKMLILIFVFILLNLFLKKFSAVDLKVQFILFSLKASFTVICYYLLGIFVLQIINLQLVLNLIKTHYDHHHPLRRQRHQT